jgi:hypothetical protein
MRTTMNLAGARTAAVPASRRRHETVAMAVLSLAVLSACGESATAPSPTVRLVEAGWSFGFCLGPCNGTLTLNGSELAYQVRSRAGDQVLAEAHGDLTTTGANRLQALLRRLPDTLQEQYGCPDCADAGAAHVVIERGTSRQRSDYEYPNPPPELAALDSFLREVMDTLGGCRSTAELSVGACTPVPD